MQGISRFTHVEIEELPPPTRGDKGPATKSVERWFERLQRRERGQLGPLHDLADKLPGQEVDQGLNLRQLRHPTAPYRPDDPKPSSPRSEASSSSTSSNPACSTG